MNKILVMKKFPGYLIKKELYYGSKTIVYRAQREVDEVYVIIKTVQSEYPSISEISQLRYEYQVSQNIDHSGILKTYSLEIDKNNIGIVKEDFNAITLKEYFDSNKVSISEFLEIAIQLANALGHLHEYNIIHKDINPSNLLINIETKQVKVTDFSIASCLKSESYQRRSYSLLEGTPAYISPEQTGRMNRLLDYRTDLYSLGVTFYELLVGHLPFQASDLLELIHCHISHYPTSLEDINKNISPVLSKIVMKLMAKNAEDRYQNALGLKADLEYCLQQQTIKGHIQNFVLGKLDHNSQFLIPQKLYGRSSEVTKLLSAFERVSNGATELILVSGFSGIGKTSIVNEIHKPILARRGYFVNSKFEQLQRNIPYYAFIKGFKTLINHLLTESSEKIDYWRICLMSYLGKNAQVIIEMIPELELVIGPQPTIPKLGSKETQNRFYQIFQLFIQVFAKADHPLVIFLDDLQWADLASLQLIERLLNNSDNDYLMIIGAYRDNEVDAMHPLVRMLDDLKSQSIVPIKLDLLPLQLSAVQELVNDTICVHTKESQPLVEIIFNKSAGNPFFANQLLQTLYYENLINFDFFAKKWSWNLEQIQAFKITDINLIDLILLNLKKLPVSTQETIKYAACIGNKFSLDTLSIISKSDRSSTASSLWIALQMGIVIPLDNNYRIPLSLEKKSLDMNFEEVENIEYQFLHDRVQQAAYSLIEIEDRENFHMSIGNLILNKTPKENLEDKIFDIVNQMNIGKKLLSNESQRIELAELNYIAGNKAKLSAAYDAAQQYFDLCLHLLPKSTWESHYKFTIELYLLSLESAYINIDFEHANNLLTEIELYANNHQDIARAYELQIPYYFTQNQPLKSIQKALEILRILNIYIPENPSKIDTLFSILKVRIAQGKRKISDFENIKLMKDSDILTAMRVLMAVIPAAFVANPSLFPIAISKMVELSLKFGNAPISIFAYNSYGTLQCGALGNINSGYRYSLLALKLLDKFNAQELKSKALMVFNAINRPWKDPLRESIKMLPEGVQAGLEIGDIEYVGHCSAFYCIYLFLNGNILHEIANEQVYYCELLIKNKQQFQLIHTNIWREVVVNLQENTIYPYILEGEYFQESITLPNIIKSKNELVIFPVFLAKALLAYIYNYYDQSLEKTKLAHIYIGGVTGFIYVAINNFIFSLSMLANYFKYSGRQKKICIRKVIKQQFQMKKWADHCPENFLHKYQLVEAEKARVLGQRQRAMELYDLAIQSASRFGYLQEEAIANERAADFFYSIEKGKIAQVYLIDAYYGYIKWGAIGKAKQLEDRYPELLSRLQNPSPVNFPIQTTENSLTTTSLIDLDLASVLKVSQAISEEIILDQLLEKLMRVLLQTAGAQSVFLILKRNDTFLIEASTTENRKTILRQSIPVSSSNQVPCSVINFVARTLEPVILGKAAFESIFSTDSYILLNQVKSLLCLPMINQGQLIGMVYLENNLAFDAFREDHLEILRLLCAQAAISLENAYLYEDLQKSQAREQAERDINELKSRFISMTSHEFRTPLTAILGTTELIKHYGQGWDTTKQHSYLDRIQKNVKHMTGLLDDVLVLSKADVGKVDFNPQKINLEEFCGNLVEELQLNTKQEQEIEYAIEGKNLDAYVDEKILRQILSNLLTNAIKYSSKNTIVRLDVLVTDEEATFYIKDQGIGIPEADQQHLFESFHRATNVGQIQGTGLGLAIVKKSVELHKGTITFESVADQGTTFIVNLPIAAEVVE